MWLSLGDNELRKVCKVNVLNVDGIQAKHMIKKKKKKKRS